MHTDSRLFQAEISDREAAQMQLQAQKNQVLQNPVSLQEKHGKEHREKKTKNYLMGELRNRLVAQLRRRVGKAREGEQGTHARHNAVRNYREVKALGGGTAWSGRMPPAGPRTLKQPAHQTTHPHHTKTLENSP